MSQVATQRTRIQDVESARYITAALRDISAIQLKNLRDRFQQNDKFYTDLRDLYQLVWRIALAAGSSEATAALRGDTLYVAYTTNRHFYGAINNNVMRTFTDSTETGDKVLVVGDTGKQIWTTRSKKRREVGFLSFAGDSPTKEETSAFLARVAPYAHVNIFYPGFVSVFRQEVQMLDITFRPSKGTNNTGQQNNISSGQDITQYLLEPDLSEMFAFFNQQVRYALFERMLLETQLSQVAARLVKMDTSDQNAQDLLRLERQELRRAFASFSSRRMLETVVGFIQWHTQKTQHIAQ